MKICIFELEHFEVVYSLIKLFDNGENQITVIISPDIEARFAEEFREGLNRYRWIIINRSAGARLRFFRSFFQAIRKSRPAVLFLNTISNNHLLYFLCLRLLPETRTVLTVHEINCLFSSARKGFLKNKAKQEGKKLLVRQINEYNVLLPAMVAALAEKVGGGKKIYQVPGSVYDQVFLQPALEKIIRIVVPGNIERKRRNYEEVLELAALAEKEKIPLQITLLGAARDDYGNAILSSIKKWNSTVVRIKFYELPVIPQPEFDRVMTESHFIYLPLVLNTSGCDGIPEVYGLTKSSGNIADLIKYARPSIAGEGLLLPAALESSSFRYQVIDEIAGFFKILLDHPDRFNPYSQASLKNAAAFTVTAIRAANPGLFGPVIPAVNSAT